MDGIYWTKTLGRRISRRRALAATGATAAAAAFLAACGGDDDGDGGGGDGGATSSLTTKPADTFSKAKRGGVLKDFMNAEPNSLDPINPQADLNNIASSIYSTLFVEKPGKFGPAEYVLQGDLAQSWEVAPDGLQVTIKLRDAAKWHNKPPVNGRAVDSADVIAALNRHGAKAPLRSLVWNAASPGGFALAPTAPDAKTVVIKFKEPIAYALNWFASFGSFTGQILMTPKETDGTFDIRQDAIGTGPFYMKEHVNSVRFVLARHPDYWDKDWALVDEINHPIVPEYIARQAQLKAGQIHQAVRNTGTDILKGEDVIAVMKDVPQLLVYQSPFVPSTAVLTFGWQGPDNFKDERVRQAMSMSFDRDLNIDVTYNKVKLEAAGLPVQSIWNSHLNARDSYVKGGWFLDPQSKDYGPNAQYFKYNVAEAKKLLTAAGHPNGFEMKWYYPNAPQFNRKTQAEPMVFFFQGIGIKVIDAGQTDYTQGYIPLNRDASGAFDGLAYHSVTGTIPSVVDATSALVAEHLPSSGVTFHGYSVGGGGGKTGDPALIQILEKARLEKDTAARKKLTLDAQRYLGKAQWNLLEPGGATGYWMAWPAVQNVGVWQGQLPWAHYQKWLDQTKAPFV